MAPAFCTYFKAIRVEPQPVSIMNRIAPSWTVSPSRVLRLRFLADAASAWPPPPSLSHPSSLAGAGALSSRNPRTSCSRSLAIVVGELLMHAGSFCTPFLPLFKEAKWISMLRGNRPWIGRPDLSQGPW
eukprot:9490013-Pyramimonas_sp.AAC.1